MLSFAKPAAKAIPLSTSPFSKVLAVLEIRGKIFVQLSTDTKIV